LKSQSKRALWDEEEDGKPSQAHRFFHTRMGRITWKRLRNERVNCRDFHSFLCTPYKPSSGNEFVFTKEAS
jgi:hypothetical protein